MSEMTLHDVSMQPLNAFNLIEQLEAEREKLGLSLAVLIDLLNLPSLFPMLSTQEKYQVEIAKKALKEVKT